MKLKMEDGRIVDTEKAAESWHEETDWDGHNYVGRASRIQQDFGGQTLYQSSQGNFYLITQWNGCLPDARFLDDKEAAKWLYLNDRSLHEKLERLETEVCE